MKAISLMQPWASLVAVGAKRIETRDWRTSYSGPLAIAASKGFPGWAKRTCEANIFARVLGWPELVGHLTQASLNDSAARIKSLPLGMILATCTLVECLPMESTGCLPGVFDDYPELNTPEERAFGNFDVIDQDSGRSRWAWILRDVKSLDQPVPVKGALGLWEWSGTA